MNMNRNEEVAATIDTNGNSINNPSLVAIMCLLLQVNWNKIERANILTFLADIKELLSGIGCATLSVKENIVDALNAIPPITLAGFDVNFTNGKDWGDKTYTVTFAFNMNKEDRIYVYPVNMKSETGEIVCNFKMHTTNTIENNSKAKEDALRVIPHIVNPEYDHQKLREIIKVLCYYNWYCDFNKIIDQVLEDLNEMKVLCKEKHLDECIRNIGCIPRDAVLLALNADYYTVVFTNDENGIHPMTIYCNGNIVVRFETRTDSEIIGDVKTTPNNTDTSKKVKQLSTHIKSDLFKIVLNKKIQQNHPFLLNYTIQSLAITVSEIDYMHLTNKKLKSLFKNMLEKEVWDYKLCAFMPNPFGISRIDITLMPENEYINEFHPLSIEFKTIEEDKVIPVKMTYDGHDLIEFNSDMIINNNRKKVCSHKINGNSTLFITDDGDIKCDVCKQVWKR